MKRIDLVLQNASVCGGWRVEDVCALSDYYLVGGGRGWEIPPPKGGWGWGV